MFSGLFLPSTALVQPVTFAVHFQDMDVVRQAVEERAGEAFGAEDFGPLVERQVRSDQDRAALIALAEDLEHELRSGFRQRHKAAFVNDQQVLTGELFLLAQETFFVRRGGFRNTSVKLIGS